MDEEKKPFTYHSADESPVPVPPAEEAWSLMQRRLDAEMPVDGGEGSGLGSGPRAGSGFGSGSGAGSGLETGAGSGLGTGLGWSGGWFRMGMWVMIGVVGVMTVWLVGKKERPRVAVETRVTDSASREGVGNGRESGGGVRSGNASRGSEDASPKGAAGRDEQGGLAREHEQGDEASGRGREGGAEKSEARVNMIRDSAGGMSNIDAGRRESGGRGSHRRRTGASQGNKKGGGAGGSGGNGAGRMSGDKGQGQRMSLSPGVALAKTRAAGPTHIAGVDSLPVVARGASGKKKDGSKQGGLWMTAGLSLGQSFPLAQQQVSSYHMLSDYIPVPYFRLYLGDRWYLQAALHFNSPQYVRPQVIDTIGGDTSHIPGYPQYLQFEKTTLKKLYYTDIPLSAHYRVFRQFYLGAGVQYSQLWGGGGQQEIILRPSNGLGSDIVYGSKTVDLKQDTLGYSRLSKSEIRILLEADFKWRRWTLGLRYEQALKPYVSSSLYGAKDTERNASYGIHIYYDLWERKK